MPGVCIGGAGLHLRRNFKIMHRRKRRGASCTEELYQSAGAAEEPVPAGQLSVALGSGKSVPEELDASMKEALALIEERIVYGTGRLYERMGGPSALMGSGALERYLRDMTHAAEIFDADLLGAVTDTLSKECRETKDVHGYEILEAISSAAEVFAVRTQMAERAEFLEDLHRQVERCSEAAQAFDCLKEFCCGYLARQSAQQENESVRPIRKAKQYIQEHYSEPITQEEVSGMVGLSPAYFSVLFKKTEGEGFARYLINVRMEQAKDPAARDKQSGVGDLPPGWVQ